MFPLLRETQNLVIDDVASTDGALELAVGTPILADKDLLYYLVGSYKYDVLNDVISNINLSAGSTAYITLTERDGILPSLSPRGILWNLPTEVL